MLVASASPVIILFISISLHFHGILNARHFEDCQQIHLFVFCSRLSFKCICFEFPDFSPTLTGTKIFPEFLQSFLTSFWPWKLLFFPTFPGQWQPWPELSILIQPSALCSDWLILWHYPLIMPTGRLWACKTKTDKPYNKKLINLKHLVFTWKSQVTLALLYWPCYCLVEVLIWDFPINTSQSVNK